MRAALGLAGNGIEDALFLQQQQRQHDIQRDLRLRQMILQEQLEQQNKLVPVIHDHQLRAIGEHLQDYPDLQQHYHTLLLREQLQHEERALLEAQAQMRYQEELRLQQQLAQEPLTPQARAEAQALAEAHVLGHGQGAHAQIQAQAVPSSVTMLRELAADSLAGNAVKKTGNDRKRSSSEDPSPARSPGPASGDELEPGPAKRPAKEKKTKSKTSPKLKSKVPSTLAGSSPQMPLHIDDHSPRITPKPTLKLAPNSSVGISPHSALNSRALTGSVSSYASLSATATPQSQLAAHFQTAYQTPLQTPLQHTSLSLPQSALHEASPLDPLRETPSVLASRFAHATPEGYHHEATAVRSPIIVDVAGDAKHAAHLPIPRFGTLEGILAAAETGDKEETATTTLRSLKKVIWPESDEESESAAEQPKGFGEGEYVELPNGFVTALPRLPEEPLYKGPLIFDEMGENNDALLDDSSATGAKEGPELDAGMEVDKARAKTRVVSNVLEYPYPIDVWWPSKDEIRRERSACGEESDEDNFEEETSLAKEQPPLRANMPAIQKRLAKDLRPGVLEKVPHCKIHRLLMRKKKNLSVPDLVFCWQVTDIYPNDTMVCCSMCGTWRHAACGGHHEPYSIRKNTETPFVAVCDFCHEEEIILRDYPNAQQRLERQRMEQIRRGLATTSVMRHASFSKHGGTYKWPLGRVSATHISGHTRSVNSRHDKAEKQWADMAKRLSNGFGTRPRERARVRTKELERLLVSVEDAGKQQ